MIDVSTSSGTFPRFAGRPTYSEAVWNGLYFSDLRDPRIAKNICKRSWMEPYFQLLTVGEFSFLVDIPHPPSDTTLIPRLSLIRSSTRFLFFTMQVSEQVSKRMTFGGKVTNSLLCDKIVRTASTVFHIRSALKDKISVTSLPGENIGWSYRTIWNNIGF